MIVSLSLLLHWELSVNFAGMGKREVYLDNAATTRMDPAVLDAMHQCMQQIHGNPSSIHASGQQAAVVLEGARRSMARRLGVSPAELVFTSGGTEANNAILWGCCYGQKVRHIITSPLEHPAVLKPLELISARLGVKVHFVRLIQDGHPDLDHLRKILTDHPGALVSLMHANNETGNLLPAKTVSRLCKAHGALFHSDMVQTIGKFVMDIPQQGIDFAAGSAHKFHGPKGAGFMYVRAGCFVEPFISGGGQERNQRAGTENLYGIVGMAKALDIACEKGEEVKQHVAALKSACVILLQERLPEIRFNGDAHKHSLFSILNLSLPAVVDPEMVLPALGMAGVAVSSGSACASGSNRGSHVLRAMAVDENAPSLRISFSKYNTPDEVHYFVDALCNLISGGK